MRVSSELVSIREGFNIELILSVVTEVSSVQMEADDLYYGASSLGSDRM